MTREVKILKSFEYGDENYEEGDVAELSDELASDVIEKGYAMANIGTEEETPTISPTDTGSDEKTGKEVRQSRQKSNRNKGSDGDPWIWREKVTIKQGKRNIKITLWPPSEKHPEWGPSLTMVESKKADDGEWNDKEIRLTRGPKTLFLSEMIREGWQKLRQEGGGGS